MATYYLDIETTGLDHDKERIVSIQYAELGYNGRKAGNINVLTEWNYGGEEKMLDTFLEITGFMSKNYFAFIPCGYNLSFEERFLDARMRHYGILAKRGISKIDIMDRPHIDLHSVGILFNRGAFRGSGLDNITAKRQDGARVPELHAGQKYNAIMEYIIDEANAFIDWYSWLVKRMPELREEWAAHVRTQTSSGGNHNAA